MAFSNENFSNKSQKHSCFRYFSFFGFVITNCQHLWSGRRSQISAAFQMWLNFTKLDHDLFHNSHCLVMCHCLFHLHLPKELSLNTVGKKWQLISNKLHTKSLAFPMTDHHNRMCYNYEEVSPATHTIAKKDLDMQKYSLLYKSDHRYQSCLWELQMMRPYGPIWNNLQLTINSYHRYIFTSVVLYIAVLQVCIFC